MSNLRFHSFESASALAEKLATAIGENLRTAIKEKGKATLIVSGGSTPKALFQLMSRLELAWEKVSIGLCDERWVPSNHPDSNEKLVKETLMVHNASKATLIGMVIDGLNASESESQCSHNVQSHLWPFDVLILGMGSDAHTASLFPGNPKLQEAYDRDTKKICISIEPRNAPHMRMSLTLNAILSAEHLYLHFQGEEKLAVYHEALTGEDTSAMPIRTVLNQNEKEVEVYYA